MKTKDRVIGIQYCSIDSSINIPLPLDQHHISDVAKWRQGGGPRAGNKPFLSHRLSRLGYKLAS